MTDSIVGVMKKVAEQEVRKIYTTELGVVTAIFPHASDSDKDNYQCSVKLKNKKLPDGTDFELRRVPVTTSHLGLANIPNVGDLVLVTFIGGNFNAPVIIGRLYNDADQPPVNKEKEFLLQHDLEGGGSFKIDAEGVVTVTSKNDKNIITVKDEEITLVNEECKIAVAGGDVTLKNQQCTIALSGGNISIDNGTCKIKVEAGGITIDAASSSVKVKSMGSIEIGDATTASIKVGGRVPANAVADNDDIILSMHTHVGNLGAPCPIMVPTEKINSIQAKIRNTQVG
jgi:phage baseplate assembly protein gpV